MEHAIGTRIIIDNDIELEVVARRGTSCKGCAFEYMDGYCEVSPYATCSRKYRTDHKDIIYKEIKKK